MAKRHAKAPLLPVSDRTIANLAQVFKLLADENRLRMLLMLGKAGEMHVSALCDLLNQSQPAVSHHLTLLKMAGLVGYRRDGKYNYYRLDGANLGEAIEELFAHAGKASKIDLGEFSLTYSKSGRRR